MPDSTTLQLTAQEYDNMISHALGVVDDCYRCVFCEIGSWNAHKEPCAR
jgi:hypothetical protein